jgi:hypothetical protein
MTLIFFMVVSPVRAAQALALGGGPDRGQEVHSGGLEGLERCGRRSPQIPAYQDVPRPTINRARPGCSFRGTTCFAERSCGPFGSAVRSRMSHRYRLTERTPTNAQTRSGGLRRPELRQFIALNKLSGPALRTVIARPWNARRASPLLYNERTGERVPTKGRGM